jgi:hypothetical protein
MSTRALGAWLGLLGVLISLAAWLLPAPNHIPWGAAVCLGLLPAPVAIALWRSLQRRRVPVPLKETVTFRPFQDLDTGTAWHRDDAVKRVVRAITNKNAILPVVIGASGAGKSVLLNVWVEAALMEQGYEVEVLSTYQAEGSDIAAEFARHQTTDQHFVLVLDQFEQWLALLRTKDGKERTEKQEWLANLLWEATEADDGTILLSIRAEWYFDLHFLGNLLPPLSQAIIVEGDSTDPGDELLVSIRKAFEKEVYDKTIADGILLSLGSTGQLSPLEAQLVGATIERRCKDGKSVSLTEFKRKGGVPGAVEAYFTAVLGSTKSRWICLKVLCAFSLQTRFRRQLTREALEEVLFEEATAVQRAVDELVTSGLLLERTSGHLDLAHDYLADFFRQKSGDELNAIERDNLFVHVQALDSAAKKQDDDVKPDIDKDRRKLGEGTRIVLTALLFMRLLDFGFHWTISGPSFRTPIFGASLDAVFIPFFVSALGWIVYVTRMYDGIFRNLDRGSSAGRVASLAILANLFVATGIGILWPSGWLLAITWGGLPVTMRLTALAYRKGLSRTARNHLLLAASLALFLGLLIAILFAAQLYLGTHVVHGSADKSRWLAANAGVALFMFAASQALSPMHTSRSGVSQMRGLMARPAGAK